MAEIRSHDGHVAVGANSMTDEGEVFEAAARLGGFQKAARELGLTGSAVSHQIRLLEDFACWRTWRAIVHANGRYAGADGSG
jgi:regulatory helix-turn-helix LysR family protein